ncbi:hypothetical protein [Streptomyces sp. NPDC047097]|uniref:hypothetical protein n=1 Tax=Streptomyces sp. NPDC047097 TaxID=3155260 RepID=UPI0034022630
MTIWSWTWIVWLGAFCAIEGKALANRTEGDTLSEHIWTWFSTSRSAAAGQPSGWVRLRRFSLLAFLAWLLAHFLSGGWV